MLTFVWNQMNGGELLVLMVVVKGMYRHYIIYSLYLMPAYLTETMYHFYLASFTSHVHIIYCHIPNCSTFSYLQNSTLLGAITGSQRIDDGKALVASKVRVGYLKQTAVSGSTKTVREEAASEMEEINNAKRRMDNLELQISNGDASEKVLNDLAKAQSRYEDVGGWTQDQDVDQVLKGLGFLSTDSNRSVADFSGGWQMRIALARLLLSKPDLLLLDEPSNHLDSSARDWLATYLSNYQGSILLVSHDIDLLSKSVNSIAEVAGNTLIQYVSCSYEKYLNEKDFRAKTAMAEYERNMEEYKRLQEFVDLWGASATKAKAAQSRVKMIEKMRKKVS
jgi:ATP-binding cassette, subfamily F, member 3